MWTQILCLLAVYYYVTHCQESENNCLPSYNSYGCRTCFKTFESDMKSFEDSQQFCSAQGTDGHLLTLENNMELSKISFYLMFDTINETFWVGMRYIMKSNQLVLVDINDNDVQLDITFEEGTLQAATGLCVSIVSRGDGEASFLREDCNKNNPFICTMSSITMEITNFTSSPDGYGLKDQSVILSCQFSPVLDPQYTTIEWYRDSQLLATTASDENYTIASFQVDHSGNYSCSVLVTVGDVVLGGAHSVEKTVRLAVLPPLSHQPQSATFYTGRIAYIECGINSNTFPEPIVKWSKDSTLIETNGRYFISPNTKSLIIKQIEVGDSGMYTCEVSNVADTITSSANLTVVDSQANETKILLHSMSLTAEVGTNMTFDCVGQDIGTKGTYQWYYFDANGVTIDNQIKRESDFSSLSFYDVQFATTPAIVRCVYGAVVSGTFLEVSNDAYLTLVEPVQITDYSDNTNFQLGTTAELQCRFKGTPLPDVQWYFKGRPISDDSRINTIASDKLVHGTTTLTIDNLQFNEIGSYQCVLSNHLQSVRREFDVCGEALSHPLKELNLTDIDIHEIGIVWKFFQLPNVVITGFIVYYNDSVLSVSTAECDINTLSCSATINNLAPFTPYIIEVSCSTGAGEGPRSNSISVMTTIGKPEAISNVILSMDRVIISGGTTSINILLPRFSEEDGRIGHYHIVVMNVTEDSPVPPDTVTDNQLKPYSALEFVYVAAVLTSDEYNPSQPYALGSFLSIATFFEGITYNNTPLTVGRYHCFVRAFTIGPRLSENSQLSDQFEIALSTDQADGTSSDDSNNLLMIILAAIVIIILIIMIIIVGVVVICVIRRKSKKSTSEYEMPSLPERDVTATKQKLPRLPHEYDYVKPDTGGPDRVDPIYEDLEASVQDLEDVIISDIKIGDDPTFDVNVKTSVYEPKDVTTSDAKRKDDPEYDSSVQSSIQKPKDVTTDVKMEDNPAYNSGVQLFAKKSKDTTTSDVKMEDNPAYDSSVQSPAQESDTVTDVKIEDKPAHNSTMKSSVQESKDTTTDVNTDNSPTYDGSIQTSVQESKDTATVDVKMEDDPSNDTTIP